MKISELENIINSQLDYQNIKVIQRGIPYFIDSLLRGTMRFSKRTGNSNSVINVDNTYKIAENIDSGNNRIRVVGNTDWIDIGSIVSFGPFKENKVVNDVDGNVVITTDRTRFSYSTMEEMLLFASPMKVNGDHVSNIDTIQVYSKYKIANGDVFGFLATDGVIQSFTEIDIEVAQLIGVSSNPEMPHVYNLNLKDKITKGFSADSVVYIRSYPAYFSRQIRVPKQHNSVNSMGAFLFDVMSGRLTETFSPKETVSLKTLTNSGKYIIGSNIKYDTINKNIAIHNRNIDSRSFVFFNQADGDSRLTKNRLVMQTKNFKYRTTEKLVPAIDFNGATYNFNTLSEMSGKLIIYIDNHQVILDLIAGSQSHSVTMPVGESNQLDLVISSVTDGKVFMSNWNLVGDHAEILEYAITTKITGIGTYQSMGASVKPYFMIPEMMIGRYDEGDSYNNGFVMF